MITLAGATPIANPATFTTKKDGSTHRVSAEAPGFKSKSEVIVADTRNVELEMTLDADSP
jgi:hypothetical protein